MAVKSGLLFVPLFGNMSVGRPTKTLKLLSASKFVATLSRFECWSRITWRPCFAPLFAFFVFSFLPSICALLSSSCSFLTRQA